MRMAVKQFTGQPNPLTLLDDRGQWIAQGRSIMSTRRNLLSAAPVLAVASVAHSQPSDDIVALFVQSAKSMEFSSDAKRLRLHGISPQTIFFSDRPDRVAGNMTTAQFVPFWNETAKDSFVKNPPNADISIFENGQLRQVVAELSDPHLDEDTFSYNVVRVLEGNLPVRGTDVALFIDVIGMPLTPFSYAGVARRTYRRAYYYRR